SHRREIHQGRFARHRRDEADRTLRLPRLFAARRDFHDGEAALMRSLLFVPGDSEKKLAKAQSCGADVLILDLEDAVAPASKVKARGMAAEYLKSLKERRARFYVRVNALSTGLADADLDAVVPAKPDGIMLPK